MKLVRSLALLCTVITAGSAVASDPEKVADIMINTSVIDTQWKNENSSPLSLNGIHFFEVLLAKKVQYEDCPLSFNGEILCLKNVKFPENFTFDNSKETGIFKNEPQEGFTVYCNDKKNPEKIVISQEKQEGMDSITIKELNTLFKEKMTEIKDSNPLSSPSSSIDPQPIEPQTQSFFTTKRLLLGTATIGAVGLVGWYLIRQKNKKSHMPVNVSTKKYQLPTAQPATMQKKSA